MRLEIGDMRYSIFDIRSFDFVFYAKTNPKLKSTRSVAECPDFSSGCTEALEVETEDGYREIKRLVVE